MDDFDDDPLDLLEDDGDGVIETILLLDDEEEEKPALQRTGCAVLLIGASCTAGAGWWAIEKFLA